MPSEGRFVIRYGSEPEVALSDKPPWRRHSQSNKTIDFRVGWRCANELPYDGGNSIEQFLSGIRQRNFRWIEGYKVYVAAAIVPAKDPSYLVIDLWLQGTFDLPNSLAKALSILEDCRKQIDAELHNTFSRHQERKQDFVEVKLPNFLSQSLTPEVATGFISRHRKGNIYKLIETVEIKNDWLFVGPEEPETIEAVTDFLAKDGSVKARQRVAASFESQKLSPFIIVLVVMLTWFFPLRGWSVGLISAALLAILGWTIYPVRYVGWRTMLGQPSYIAATGFFGISAFGVAYAICALLSDRSLGPVDRLGYPFLLATSLGVAGGVLGNPEGIIRVLIHIQLLLFLGWLIGLVAVLFRIERDVARRG